MGPERFQTPFGGGAGRFRGAWGVLRRGSHCAVPTSAGPLNAQLKPRRRYSRGHSAATPRTATAIVACF
eukprot:3306514-Alexandrium_andersonii.AAC.1